MKESPADIFKNVKSPFRRSSSNYTRHSQAMPRNSWTSRESGRSEVFVQAFPGLGGKQQVSTEGGIEAAWSRSGRELFFRSGRKMMSVDIVDGPVLKIGKPWQLFEGSFELYAGAQANFDVSPDGQHFLMIKSAGETFLATSRLDSSPNGWSIKTKQLNRGVDREIHLGPGFSATRTSGDFQNMHAAGYTHFWGWYVLASYGTPFLIFPSSGRD